MAATPFPFPTPSKNARPPNNFPTKAADGTKRTRDGRPMERYLLLSPIEVETPRYGFKMSEEENRKRSSWKSATSVIPKRSLRFPWWTRTDTPLWRAFPLRMPAADSGRPRALGFMPTTDSIEPKHHLNLTIFTTRENLSLSSTKSMFHRERS